MRECIGALRDASSYTSGIWFDTYSWQLDSVTGFWIPDVHAVYQDSLEDLGLSDTRTITHDTRFMLTNNSINPNVYRVSKILDMYPQGLVKFTLKQDEFDPNRDNVSLRICDYYDRSGPSVANEPCHYEHEENNIISLDIVDGELSDGGALKAAVDMSGTVQIEIGKPYYFGLKNWDYGQVPDWRINLEGDSANGKASAYYENLIRIEKLGKTSICVKAGKAPSLVGKKFILCVCDADGYSHSSITLEVTNAS